jgi:hypothetical protein
LETGCERTISTKEPLKTGLHANGGIREMSKPIYVTCTVSRGLFDSEFYVTVRESSIYIDRVNVQVQEPPHNGGQVEGKVLAYLLEEKSDRALIELPGEPVVGGLRAWIPKADWAYAY